MTPTDTPRNIPLPDELASVREQIKALQAREQEIRNLLIAHPDVREGAGWLAEIRKVTVEHTDLREMRACHPALVSEFTFPRAVVRVELSAITEDGQLISARAMRSAEK